MRTDPQDPQDRDDHSPFELIFEMVESTSIQRGHDVRKKELLPREDWNRRVVLVCCVLIPKVENNSNENVYK